MISSNPSNWLNPRRMRCAKAVLDFLYWHGRKVYLSPDRYVDLQDHTGLERYVADQAVSDLYELGAIDIRFAGETQVLEMLSSDLDDLAAKQIHTKATKITLSNNKNGAWR